MEPMRPEPFTPGAPEELHRRHVGDDTTATGPLVEWPELEERLAEEAARMDIDTEGIPYATPARRPLGEEAELEAFPLRPAPPFAHLDHPLSPLKTPTPSSAKHNSAMPDSTILTEWLPNAAHKTAATHKDKPMPLRTE